MVARKGTARQEVYSERGKIEGEMVLGAVGFGVVSIKAKTRTLCKLRKEMRHPLRFGLAPTGIVCGCAFVAVLTWGTRHGAEGRNTEVLAP